MRRVPSDNPKDEVGSFDSKRNKSAPAPEPARRCQHCSIERPVMMRMDGEWFLCVRCWCEGLVQQPVPSPVVRLAARARETEFRFTGETGTFVPDEDNFW